MSKKSNVLPFGMDWVVTKGHGNTCFSLLALSFSHLSQKKENDIEFAYFQGWRENLWENLYLYNIKERKFISFVSHYLPCCLSLTLTLLALSLKSQNLCDVTPLMSLPDHPSPFTPWRPRACGSPSTFLKRTCAHKSHMLAFLFSYKHNRCTQ